MKKLKNEMRWKMNKSLKWSWFKVPVKVEQINEYLFSDTVQSQKTKSGNDEISQGQCIWTVSFAEKHISYSSEFFFIGQDLLYICAPIIIVYCFTAVF